MITTISLPAFSARRATSTAAQIAAPDEMPTSSPSSFAERRAIAKASSFFTWMTSSLILVLRMSGTKPAPMPWIVCGPFTPPDRTGEASGSTAIALKDGLRALMTSPTPVIVPPVPTPETRMSTLPSVSRQISSAVVLRWISGLAGFLNCCGMK